MENREMTKTEVDTVVAFMKSVLENMKYEKDVDVFGHNGDLIAVDSQTMDILNSALGKMEEDLRTEGTEGTKGTKGTKGTFEDGGDRGVGGCCDDDGDYEIGSISEDEKVIITKSGKRLVFKEDKEDENSCKSCWFTGRGKCNCVPCDSFDWSTGKSKRVDGLCGFFVEAIYFGEVSEKSK